MEISREVNEIILKSYDFAKSNKDEFITAEHLLYGITFEDRFINALEELNYNAIDLRKKLDEYISEYIEEGNTDSPVESYSFQQAIIKASEQAIFSSKKSITMEHLISAIYDLENSYASFYLQEEGIEKRDLLYKLCHENYNNDDYISEGLISEENEEIDNEINVNNKKDLIKTLTVNLNEQVKGENSDPLIGREEILERTIQILCRRTKNNPILIGDAGVGKTAIVEELSRLIVNDEVPKVLCDKKIISLDMATMVAGTKYRGEFEERMKKVIKEIEDNDDIILFIDEIHTLVGAGGAEGAIDASNILKPALARGKIRCIGATTTEEYKKFIEKDSALERRFQKIFVNEPSIGETKNILMNIKDIYEKYHNVIIDNDMIDYIINLSEKYIFDRNRPDKEIDILDEVASRVGLRGCTSDNEVRDIKREICKLNKDKNSFIIDNNIDKAYSLRKKETELMSRLNDIELLSRNNKNKILLDDIASVISNRTGVPIYEIISNSGNIDDMKNSLKDIIVGEDKAIDNLMDITKRIRCGYNDRCYSLLFVGSSGVGKSRLAKEYANILVGADNLIRMDMSEYSDSTAINKILGSSPGYIGYDDNKNILEEIRNKPNSVLLLDEIDKAHPNVINLFYQILEEGKIKNSKGREVRFNNVVVIMTSNIGFEKNGIGFNKKTDSSVISSLKGYFNTAFINRIDNIIVFDRLEETSIKCIIRKKFEYIRDKYKDINIDINDNVTDEIVDKCEFYEFGARRIDKIISKDIENVIIDGVIRGDKDIYIDSIVKKNITS